MWAKDMANYQHYKQILADAANEASADTRHFNEDFRSSMIMWIKEYEKVMDQCTACQNWKPVR
jgi:hypothetical protein